MNDIWISKFLYVFCLIPIIIINFIVSMLNSIPLSYTSLSKIKTGPDAIAAEMQINAIKKVLAVMETAIM